MSQRQYSLPSVRPPSRKTPLTPQVLDFISTFSQLANDLFTQIASSIASPSTPPPHMILDAFADLDLHLHSLLGLAAQHSRQQQCIENLLQECSRGDGIWKESAESLRAASEVLGRICARGAKIGTSAHLVKAAQIDADTILSYAKLIAPYTSAPLAARERGPLVNDAAGSAIGSTEMSDPTVRAMLPFPTEDTIRMGRMGVVMMSDEPVEGGIDVGETRRADAVRPGDLIRPVTAQPLTQRRPPEVVEEDVFDLDLNPDL